MVSDNIFSTVFADESSRISKSNSKYFIFHNSCGNFACTINPVSTTAFPIVFTVLPPITNWYHAFFTLWFGSVWQLLEVFLFKWLVSDVLVKRPSEEIPSFVLLKNEIFDQQSFLNSSCALTQAWTTIELKSEVSLVVCGRAAICRYGELLSIVHWNDMVSNLTLVARFCVASGPVNLSDSFCNEVKYGTFFGWNRDKTCFLIFFAF